MPDDEIQRRVAGAERDIDAYFERELKIGGLYRPALISAMLDVTEQLVTGHRAPVEKYDDAIRALYINVVGGLNWALRRAAQLGSVSRRPVPDNLDRIAHHCISDGMAYPFVESAFYSYWKGYATVAFLGDREISFTPTGGDLDARLRRHDSRDGIDDSVKPIKQNPLLDVESPLAEKFSRSLMKRSVVKNVGGFIWKVDKNVVKTVADVMTDFIGSRIEAPDMKFGGLSLTGLVRGVGVVLAVSQIHALVSVLMGKDPTDVSTSVNWPSLFRHKREWHRWFELGGADEQVLAALTFDFKDKYGDIATTPLVPMADEYLGVVPSVVMRSNWTRNLLALLARRFGDVYSTYSASKEDRLLSSFRGSETGQVRGRKIQLPEWKGRRLPDIDLIVSTPDDSLVAIAEVKWQLSASETRDVIARNEYLKKGAEQLSRIREFLSENPGYLRDRKILGRALEQDRTIYLLLCKGHMASEDVIRPGIVVADWDVFCDYIGRLALADAAEKLVSYEYLPVAGRDFTVDVTRLQFGDWVLGWKQFHAPELPPDTETEALEELYRTAYKFFPRDR